MSYRFWRNGLVFLLLVAALAALFYYGLSGRSVPGYVQTGNVTAIAFYLAAVLDVTALIAFVLTALVLLFSGTGFDQKLSRQLRFFCLLSGWSLAYCWPATASVRSHVVAAAGWAAACYLLLLVAGVRRRLAVAQNRERIQYLLAILCVNLLLAPILLVLYVSPLTAHAAAEERAWIWPGFISTFRLGLWAVAAAVTLVWSVLRSAGAGRKAYVGLILVVCAAGLGLAYSARLPAVRQVSLDAVAQGIDAGEVQKLVITGNTLRAYTANGQLVASKESGSSALETLRNLGVSDQKLRAMAIEVGQAGFWEVYGSGLLVTGGLLLLAVAVVYAVISIGRNNQVYANQFTKAPPAVESGGKTPKVTFKDVGGANEAKDALQDIVNFLKQPQTFAALGARMPKGILLEGPPGTGKTLLAQAVAGEAGVPFFYMSGSQFIEMFVGVGASRVRSLFEKAKQAAPSVVFIDELDAVGQRREGAFRSNQENSQTLNQLLTELDGFEANSEVVIIAATNRADILDEALTRPGRFDRRIMVNLPNPEEREAILKIHLKGKPLSANVKGDDLSQVSRQAYDMSGADLAAVANQSAILAAKAGHKAIQTDHLAAALKQTGAVMPDVQVPALMVEAISRVVVGQESAIRAVASAIYQHYCDLRASNLNGGEYTTKPNILLAGPPGTGKTLIVRTVAQQLQVPFAAIDAGAIANNPDNTRIALGRLLTAANNDLRRARHGIVCIYGIENLLAPDLARMQQEMGRDAVRDPFLPLSGLAHVQEELGRIIEGATFDITRHQHSFNSQDVSISTEHVIFICEGTFTLEQDLIRDFSGSVSQHRCNQLIALGFTPRLLDKFPVIASTEPLSADQLQRILSDGESAPLRQYQRRFAAMGVELRFEDGAHQEIVSEAISRGGGARWLGQILEEVLQDHLCAEDSPKEVTITGAMIRAKIGVEVTPVITPGSGITPEGPGLKVGVHADSAAGRPARVADYQPARGEPEPLPLLAVPEPEGSAGPPLPPGLPQMEIVLDRQKDGCVRALHNARLSHTFDPDELAPAPGAASRDYAEKIYQALFGLEAALRDDLDAGPWRILLVTTDPALEEIPWECACGPGGPVILKHHFVRALPAGQRITPPVLDRALHIVAVPATPLAKGVPALNVEGEWLRLKDTVQEVGGSIHLERTYPPTLERLRNLAANRQNGIVHFMGHGKKSSNGVAVLCLENEYGDLAEVTAQDFVQRMNRTVFMVCLNACMTAQPGPTEFSNLAAALTARQVPYALGMRTTMADAAALTFARTLYGEMARGSSVEEAVMQARQQLAATSGMEAASIPVVYTSLSRPAQGFPRIPGAAKIEEWRPTLELSALHQLEGLFQGRVDELKEIGKRLTGDQRSSVLTIHGAGGQGKTVLARAAAERFAHAWPGGVWACSLENLPSRETFVRGLARFLGLSEDEQADPATVERQALAQLAERRTLIVLDNAETLVEAVDRQDQGARDLAQFIRQNLPAQRAGLLITSRVLMGWGGEKHLELGGLDPEAGGSVFLQSVPRKIGQDGGQFAAFYGMETLAAELSEKLDGHPLGLFLLGKAYHAGGKPLAEFVREFEAVLFEARDRYMGDSDRHQTLYACIDASVRSLDDNLRGLLARLYIFHSPFLPEMAAAVLGSGKLFDSYELRGTLMDIGTPYDRAEPLPDQEMPIQNKMNTDWEFGDNPAIYGQLDTLWQRGLLERYVYADGKRREVSRALVYRLLPTIRSYLETTSDTEGAEFATLLARFGEAYTVLAMELAANLTSSPVKVQIVEQSLEDLARGLDYALGKARLEYLHALSFIMNHLGERQKSVNLASEARQLAETLEPEPPNPHRSRSIPEEVENRLMALGSESLALFDGGQPASALPLMQQVLLIARKYNLRAEEANALHNTGQVYQALGQPQEAVAAFRQALALSKQEKDRVGEAKALNGLGLVYLIAYSDYGKALDHFAKARRAWENQGTSGFEQPDQSLLANIFNNMGETYRRMGKTAEAIDLFQQALPLQKALHDPLEAVTLYNLAHVFRLVGAAQEADRYCEQALTASQKTGNRDVEAAAYIDMAGRQAGERAERLLRKGCEIYRETGQAAFEASALASLATALSKGSEVRQQAIDEAVSLEQRAIRLLEDNGLQQDAGGGTLDQHRNGLKTLLAMQER